MAKQGRKTNRKPKAKAAVSVEPTALEVVEAFIGPTEEIVAKKIGRPSKYDPAMCETVLELGEQGKSKAQIAKALGVTRPTLDSWSDKHPDFLYALKAAKDLELAWWEDKGQAGLDAGQGNFNATAFIFQMKNRFRSDYRDQQDHNHGVSDELGELLARIDAGPRNLPSA
jgi:helix-turn-helix resolvase-like protein